MAGCTGCWRSSKRPGHPSTPYFRDAGLHPTRSGPSSTSWPIDKTPKRFSPATISLSLCQRRRTRSRALTALPLKSGDAEPVVAAGGQMCVLRNVQARTRLPLWTETSIAGPAVAGVIQICMLRDLNRRTGIAIARITSLTLPGLKCRHARWKCMCGDFDRNTSITHSLQAMIADPIMTRIVYMPGSGHVQAYTFVLTPCRVAPLAFPVVAGRCQNPILGNPDGRTSIAGAGTTTFTVPSKGECIVDRVSVRRDLYLLTLLTLLPVASVALPAVCSQVGARWDHYGLTSIPVPGKAPLTGPTISHGVYISVRRDLHRDAMLAHLVVAVVASVLLAVVTARRRGRGGRSTRRAREPPHRA